LVGPLVGGRSQEDHSRPAILDIGGTYQTRFEANRGFIQASSRNPAHRCRR
jgi:hypothetical protein